MINLNIYFHFKNTQINFKPWHALVLIGALSFGAKALNNDEAMLKTEHEQLMLASNTMTKIELFKVISKAVAKPNGANVLDALVNTGGFVAGNMDSDTAQCIGKSIALASPAASSLLEVTSKGLPLSRAIQDIEQSQNKALKETVIAWQENNGLGDMTDFEKAHADTLKVVKQYMQLINGTKDKAGLLDDWLVCSQ